MDIPLLPEIVAIFCLSIGVALLCHKLRIPSIVGLLLTGVLCGPSTLGLVSDVHAVEKLADIGVVLLMFTIGMELSGEELTRLRKPLFIGGTAQVVLTVLAFTGLAVLAGRTPAQGVLFGFLGALSSTAIVLSLFQQKAQSESPQARLALAALIFQDIAIVPMMLLIPFLAGQGQENSFLSLAFSGIRTAVLLGGGWFLAKHGVPRLMTHVMRTRNRELLLLTTLSLCLMVALITAALGLSLSLGAFLAGVLLAGSEYSLSELEGVLPFKTVFTSLFFISVGMLLDVDFALSHLDRVLLTAVLLIVVKSLMAFPAMLILGYPVRIAIIAALCLAQIGEFSFVLAKTGVSYGLLDHLGYQMFLAGSIITMTLTPIVMGIAPTLARFLTRRLPQSQKDSSAETTTTARRDHLIIVGFGVGGQLLARTARKAGIPYVILEMNPETVTRYRNVEPIHHGDATRPLIMEHFGISAARVLVVAISDPAAVRGAVSLARSLNPCLHIVVRTRFLGELQELKRLGANDVIPEDFETAIEIFTRVLGYYLVPRQTIETFVNRIRDENYEMARKLSPHDGTSISDVSGTALTGFKVVPCVVEKDAPLADKRLSETDLRTTYGLTVVGLCRQGETIPSPAGTEQLRAGDIVYLFGKVGSLTPAMPLFTGHPVSETTTQ